MNIFDTLIIGSGYAPAGYAAANKNTLICEENQICDTNFYLPLSSFSHTPYTPKTVEGKDLEKEFDELSLFKGNSQNANGFECAFCKYLAKNPLNILLKCRVISTEKTPDGVFCAKVQTNEGISHFLARKIIDSRGVLTKKSITVLFTSSDIEKARPTLLSCFKNSKIEEAFYKQRYAIRIETENADENLVKNQIYNKWCTLDIDAKILYIAPQFCGREDKENPLCDANYQNPIEAFENGYFFAKEERQ